MDLRIELNEQAAQPVLFIRTRTALEGLPLLIGESYRKIAEYLAELGQQPANAPYTAYYNLDMQDLDVEMGFPVAGPLPGKDEVKAGEIPAGRYVSCMFKGPYSQMEPVYNEMNKWMQENKLEPAGAAYEYYYNGPQDVPESELLTRISLPVK
ncbi:MAG: GyrI-like domain-containing protein [Desulfotomaculaceae bacterium]|nr:GyrI-like domain-containing protein [Desulfotomaculaceae bacterium]